MTRLDLNQHDDSAWLEPKWLGRTWTNMTRLDSIVSAWMTVLAQNKPIWLGLTWTKLTLIALNKPYCARPEPTRLDSIWLNRLGSAWVTGLAWTEPNWLGSTWTELTRPSRLDLNQPDSAQLEPTWLCSTLTKLTQPNLNKSASAWLDHLGPIWTPRFNSTWELLRAIYETNNYAFL